MGWWGSLAKPGKSGFPRIGGLDWWHRKQELHTYTYNIIHVYTYEKLFGVRKGSLVFGNAPEGHEGLIIGFGGCYGVRSISIPTI